MVLDAADVILATTIQAQTDLLKDIVFDHVIIDESSVLTHLEMLCAWRGTEPLTLIGDTKQLPTTVLTTGDQNPFSAVLSYGPFQRFSDLGLRVFTLRHVMRMSAGLENLCNETFYDSRLIRGPGTSLEDPKRKLSILIQDRLHQALPQIKEPPSGLVYPVFLDVQGKCWQEPNGTSKWNPHNIALVIANIKGLKEELAEEDYDLKNHQVGIACPYSAQVRAFRKALVKAREFGIRVDVTESWQGEEADITFIDFVRAKNPDLGTLGFLTKKERLNVLLSRQRQFLFVVGDIKCCGTGTSAPTPDDDTADVEKQKPGALATIEMPGWPNEEYVTFPEEIEAEAEEGGWDGSGDEKVKESEDERKKGDGAGGEWNRWL